MPPRSSCSTAPISDTGDSSRSGGYSIFYKWIPTAFDLFGTDNSSSAHWASVWGLKGRYDERDNVVEADKSKLNEHARGLYRQEVVKLVERPNMFIPERERWLKVVRDAKISVN